VFHLTSKGCGSRLLPSFINRKDSMAKFGRSEFGKDKPSETYEGDHMMLEKGYVKIIRGGLDLIDFETKSLIAVIYLDKGQSMREIGTD
jgi:nicotinamide riboside kinase